MVGAGGMVNTNAFVASTFDIANDKFMAGDQFEMPATNPLDELCIATPSPLGFPLLKPVFFLC